MGKKTRTCKDCGLERDRLTFRTVKLPHRGLGYQVERYGVCDSCAGRYEFVRDKVADILSKGGNVACYAVRCHGDDAVFIGKTYHVRFITREGGFKIFLTPDELHHVVPYCHIPWDSPLSVEEFEAATGIKFIRFPDDFPTCNKDSNLSRWSYTTNHIV